MSENGKCKSKNCRHRIREWTFRVHCSTHEGETVCVTGNVPELGDWSPEKGVVLTRESLDSPDFRKQDDLPPVWSVRMQLPAHKRIEYRFYVCMLVDDPAGKAGLLHIVRRWESHLNPRIISHNDMPAAALLEPEAEIFGDYDGAHKIDRGWLTAETVIQFKISNNPLQFWRKKYKNGTIRMKMVTLNLTRQNSFGDSAESNSVDFLEDYDSLGTNPLQDNGSNTFWPLCEIAVMNEEEYELKLQDQFGRVYQENDIIIFQAQVLQLSSVAYMVDFYMDNNMDIPTHIGFCHILPLTFQQTIGTIAVPITNMKQEPIGKIAIEYLIVRPMPECPCDLKVSYARHWKHTWTGLDVGHRGSGNSAKAFQGCANLRENTIASLQQAAEKGADFVEFDVQLSKDLVPVLFHDFYVNIGLEQKAKKGGELTTLTVPMKDLTLAQLHELKVFHVTETPADFQNDLSNDHDPFPTLEHALEVLSSHVGFNIEIKWTMQLKDGSWELENPIELNVYLDSVLKVVLEHAGQRKIVFSCFHPDICTMIRLKQNKYPVLFLTQGVTSKYPEYNDPRTQNIPIAIEYALSANILGLSVHTEDILRDPSQVKRVLSHGLVCFCWGDENNDKGTIKYLKELGLNGIIYDRIEDHINDDKTNIFVVEDSEELFNLASKSVFSPHTPHSCVTSITEDSLHIDDDEELNGNGFQEDSAIETVNGSFNE